MNVDIKQVTNALQAEIGSWAGSNDGGVQAFAKSWSALMARIREKGTPTPMVGSL